MDSRTSQKNKELLFLLLRYIRMNIARKNRYYGYSFEKLSVLYHRGMQSLNGEKVAFDRHVFVVVFCVFAWYSIKFPTKEIYICMEVIINVVQ